MTRQMRVTSTNASHGAEKHTVSVMMGGKRIGWIDVPSRTGIQYLINHPKSRYRSDLNAQLRNNGLCKAEIDAVYECASVTSPDEVADMIMDAEDKKDGSNYRDTF